MIIFSMRGRKRVKSIRQTHTHTHTHKRGGGGHCLIACSNNSILPCLDIKKASVLLEIPQFMQERCRALLEYLSQSYLVNYFENCLATSTGESKPFLSHVLFLGHALHD